MTSSIVLLSGGLDSLVSLALTYKKTHKILALTFNYGQKSFQSEIISSQKIAEHYNINHKVVDLPWLAEISTSSLNSDENIPILDITQLDNIDTTSDSAKSVWVPNRNGLFVNIAGCFAEANGYNSVIIGANKEEAATFKDNTVQFIDAVNNSFTYSMNDAVSLVAPLINYSKEDIVKIGIELNVPFELLHSCYLGNDIHCGQCESCLRLKRALIQNGRDDVVQKIFIR